MKKSGKAKGLSNIKITVKTIVPLVLLFALTIANGVSGVQNPTKIMEATNEVNQVHFPNVYNLEVLNFNFEQLKRVVYQHCLTEEQQMKRNLEAEIGEIYAKNTAVIESLTLSRSFGEYRYF